MFGGPSPKFLSGAGLAALAAAGAGLWYQLFRRPLPRASGRVELAGLEDRVEVRRDRWGVPHIRARSMHDLWFGQGFCHGQDRLWQLDLYRRFACGTVAEMAGPEGLALDRFVRTLGLRRVALREEAALAPEIEAALEAYSAGVNAAAATAAAPPIELQLLRLDFEPWRPADTLTITKLLSLGLSTNWERELLRADMTREIGPELAARLDPGYPAGNPVVLAPGEPWRGDGAALAEQIASLRETLGFAAEATGSNNWAVAGSRSATGGPLTAGDPHLPPSMPGITYQLGVYLGERFCRGASFPGRLGIVFGQNNDVAWSITNVLADVMDLYVERIDADTYEFEGERRPLELTEEEIAVRGRAAPERLLVRSTHHGPIVNEALRADPAEPLALSWSALTLPTVTGASLGGLGVTNGPELIASLEPHNAPVSNLIWADRHGSIGYKLIGRLPLRRGDCPDLPKPGWTADHEWDGWVPYDELPELTDPDSGYLVTANNRIVPNDYPHHITSDYLDGYRARRIEDLLRPRDDHDLAGFGELQLDLLSIPGLETAHRLARLGEQPGDVPLHQREIAAIERLRSWDGRMDPDSIGASIYQAFTLRLGRLFAREVIRDRDLAERWLDRADNGFSTHVASPWRWQSHLLALWAEGDDELVGRPWDELVLDALRGALDDLSERFGPNPAAWRWGRVHALEFEHALGAANPLLALIFNRTLEVGGAQETVTQVGWDPHAPYRAIWAPAWRMLADPREPERSRWQQFAGQSGHPASGHYDDLQPRWLAGETQRMAGEGPWRVLELTPERSG
ncbi:MAG: penicillin acylase family protein [Solirubrobacterales bacterium]